MCRAVVAFALMVLIAAPAFAWSSVNDCIADMASGNPNAIVQVPPSVVGNEPAQTAYQWCLSHNERGYRLSELNKAIIGLLIIVAAFAPALILTICRRRHGRTMLEHVADIANLAVWNAKDERFRKAQLISFVGAIVGLNALVFGSALFR